jgi:hypothetical protein
MTDGAFWVRRFQRIATDNFAKEFLWDRIDIPFRLLPGTGAPSRTTARWPGLKISYAEDQRHKPVAFLRDAMRPSRSIRALSAKAGIILVDRLREAMVTRGRDLEAIAYANPDDAVIAECEGGLAFLGVSMIPERRFLFETLYVYLIVKNEIPIGYFQATAFLGAAELNYNIFPPFRGREAARIYARGVSVARAMLGVDRLSVDPYQLGDGNREALESGSFWFYYKLGYRPRDEERRSLLEVELSAMRTNANHRSPRATLKRLARDAMYLDLVGKRRREEDVDVAAIGLAVTDLVAARFGADRERATRALALEAREALSVPDFGAFSRCERAAWERWAPIIGAMPDLARWSRAEKAALIAVIRAKGGRREHVYAQRLDAHARLRRSLAALSTSHGAPTGG